MLRSLLVAVPLLAAGCFDFAELQKGFCQTSHAAFCDDFEGPTIDPRWQPRASGGGTVEIFNPASAKSSLLAVRGRQALISIAPENADAQLIESAVTGTYKPDTGSFSVRMFTFIAPPLSPGEVELASIRDASDAAIATFSMVEGVPRLSEGATGRHADGSRQFLPGKWECFELRVSNEATGGVTSAPHLALFINASEALGLARLGSLPTLASTRIGPSRGKDGGVGTATILMDEVIVDAPSGDAAHPAIPVGCAQ